jgi:glucokinase
VAVPFADGTNGVSYQILKIVSKSPFLREVNKSGRVAQVVEHLPSKGVVINSNPTSIFFD